MLRLVQRSSRIPEASCWNHLRGCAGKYPAWHTLSPLHDARALDAGCSSTSTTPVFIRRLGTAASESLSADHSAAGAAPPLTSTPPPVNPRDLPLTCPGCGALSQTVMPSMAGYYSPKKKNPKPKRKTSKNLEDEIFERAIRSGVFTDANAGEPGQPVAADEVPLCARCRDLIYQHRGTSIAHPSMQSIRAMIEESPHEHNHIYHIVDAADFPMSLIPNLVSSLNLTRLRTQNRRSKSHRHGRLAEVTFIITRSDLLAPKKEQVDAMLPLLREILRDALGKTGKSLRLGNVRCVSAQRGWWTPPLKEEIYTRGGAGWMVGKVNVGKSALFRVVYPKGRNAKKDVNIDQMREKELQESIETKAIPGITPDPIGEDMEGLRDIEEDSSIDQDQAMSPMEVDSGAEVDVDRSLETTSDDPMEPTSVVEDDLEAGIHNQQYPYLPPEAETAETQSQLESSPLPEAQESEESAEDTDLLDDDEDLTGPLLPPAQQETQYPHMPTVSTVAGTTASPIRIPYGNGKGELIDLPGVERSNLAEYVKQAERKHLVMKSRPSPEQYTIKPDQSLVLGGGLIRITPSSKDADLVFLAYPFLPLEPHVTATRKAINLQTLIDHDDAEGHSGNPDDPESPPTAPDIPSIATDAAREKIQKAGSFKLAYNVTKQRTGSLTDPTAGKQKVADLPFTIYSADILVEGIGWIELVCQVRNWRRQPVREPIREALGLPKTDVFGEIPEEKNKKKAEEENFPEVEVWTPEGKFVDVRRPINAWMLGGRKQVAKHKQRVRPRQTISMQRRKEGGAGGAKTTRGKQKSGEKEKPLVRYG